MPVAVGTGGTSKPATWVSFKGDTVPTILNDSNIASIDRISKGLYEITFKEPMSSDDYSVNATVGFTSGTAANVNIVGTALDKTKCYVAMRTVGTTSPAAFESDATRISIVATDNPTLSVGSGGGTPATYVTFDGTTTPPTIKGSNNVSSVVKNTTGDYTINFTTPMSDSDYAVSLSNVSTSSSINTVNAKIKGSTLGGAELKTPTQLTIKTAGTSSSVDMSLVSVAIIDKNSSLGGSGSSIWTEEGDFATYDGQVKATYDNSEAQSNTAEPKQTLSLTNPNGDDGTGDNNYTSLGFNVADGATSKGFITYSRGGDNKGKFVFSQRTGSDTYATQMVLDGDGFVKLTRDGQEININPAYGGAGGNAIMESNDPIGLISNSKLGLLVKTDGSIDMPQVYNGFNTSNGPNIYMSSDGKLHRSTSAFYSTEEVDKKLAIKDKLIEKLSARLDKLEKRVK
jgi:hypothetical protein